MTAEIVGLDGGAPPEVIPLGLLELGSLVDLRKDGLSLRDSQLKQRFGLVVLDTERVELAVSNEIPVRPDVK